MKFLNDKIVASLPDLALHEINCHPSTPAALSLVCPGQPHIASFLFFLMNVNCYTVILFGVSGKTASATLIPQSPLLILLYILYKLLYVH